MKFCFYFGMQFLVDFFQIGNYIGVLFQWWDLQILYDVYFLVVDLYVFMVVQDLVELCEKICCIVVQYIVVGIEFLLLMFYVQLYVCVYVELVWIFSIIIGFGEVGWMMQFKDKLVCYGVDVMSVGLFIYLVLMVVDILFYQMDVVLVGDDQKQYVEFICDFVECFNLCFGEIFMVLMLVIQKEIVCIYDLQNLMLKMLKFVESDVGVLWMFDELVKFVKKIMWVVIDNEGLVCFDWENKLGVFNFFMIYVVFIGWQVVVIEDEYVGCGYGDFKKGFVEVVVEEFGLVCLCVLELFDDLVELDCIFVVNVVCVDVVVDVILFDVYDWVGLFCCV